ncbi:MAG: GTP-binding protein, partial [Rectinemataceae bacterium]|nr:GTP-binding protein [Rectinemataceae bacterium]
MNVEKVGTIFETIGRYVDSVRNIGILAHIDAGKTSLTERLLHVAGRRPVTGGVDEGTTATDYLEVERERGITVKAASVNFGWKGSRIHLIDTPGHVDFGAEVDRSIRALDGAILAVCGVAGVQSRTEVLVRACTRAGLPRLVFVNKMDRKGSDFHTVLDDLKSSIEPGAVAIQIPWGKGELLTGVINLIEMEAFADSDDICDSYPCLPIPDYLLPEAFRLRSILIESLADCDDRIMEDYINVLHIPATRIRTALRTATLRRILVPVLCGTAFSALSAALLLDAVKSFLPSPAEALTPEGTEPG